MCNANCVHHCYKSDTTAAPSAVTVAPSMMTSGGSSNCILGCLCPDKLNGTCHVRRTESCEDRLCWKQSITANFEGFKKQSCCIHDNCIVGEDMHASCFKSDQEAQHPTSETKGKFSVYSRSTQKSYLYFSLAGIMFGIIS